MKKVLSIFVGFFFLILSFTTQAQTQSPKEYFVGKWDVLLEGLPQGDPKMIVSLQRKDGKLEGAILDSTQKEAAKISRVEETEKTVTVYFTAHDYDVNLEMNKKDDNNITVNLMGMFEGKGVRMKEIK